MVVENELKKLQKTISCFRGKSYFEEGGTQNYLVIQPMYRYFISVSGTGAGNYIYFCKSKGFSDERINSVTVSNYSIAPELS